MTELPVELAEWQIGGPGSANDESRHRSNEPNSQPLSRVASSQSALIASSLSEERAKGLPTVDRGWHAWLFVANAFMLETMIWGWRCDTRFYFENSARYTDMLNA
jgi:hypothetical protein